MEVGGRRCLVGSAWGFSLGAEHGHEAVIAEIQGLARATTPVRGDSFPERLVAVGRLRHEGVWLHHWRDVYGVLPTNLHGPSAPLPQAVAVPPPAPRFQTLRSLWCFAPERPLAPPVPSATVREAFRTQWLHGDGDGAPKRAVGKAVKRAARQLA